MAVASNAPFSEWGQTFADPRLAAAVVDRLTFPGVGSGALSAGGPSCAADAPSPAPGSGGRGAPEAS